MLLIDKYAYTNRLSNTNPKIKMGIGLIFLILSMITHNILILLSIIFLMSTAIVFIAKVDFKSYLNLLRIPLYFLIIGVITNLINISFESDSMIHSFKVLNIYIGVSSKSLESSKYILIRSISCLTCIYFLYLQLHLTKYYIY